MEDGETAVREEAVAPGLRVERAGGACQFEDFQVAVDGPLGAFQLGGEAPGVPPPPALDELQDAEDAGDPDALPEAAVGFTTFLRHPVSDPFG